MEKLEKPRFSVSDLIASVNQTFEYAYNDIEVEGEVASFKVNQNKFIFFDIKDEAGSLNCFMTIWQLRIPIEDGMKVVIVATPKITGWGKFSLTVKSIRPSGEGAIKKSHEILKAKLDTEGLFALDRKRTLPRYPRHIAVISSVQAAGYADFVKILNDRWGGLVIDVASVQVQGTDAPDQIIQAINFFNQQELLPEILVIIRGGGSADDLSAFNDEPLVRAIAASRIPTLVGVGHETDESLSDLVADVRAATPSNAAQILVPDKSEIINSVKIQIRTVLSRMLQIADDKKRLVIDLLSDAMGKIDRNVDEYELQVKHFLEIISQLDPQKGFKSRICNHQR